MRAESRDPIGMLRTLGQEHRHRLQAGARESPGSGARRRLDKHLRELRDQFERIAVHWVRDDDLRAAWMRYLHADGPAPEAPRFAPPPLFKGVTEAGSVLELREAPDRGFHVVMDGAVIRHELTPWRQDPDLIEPITIGEHSCREIFDAPGPAVDALVAFLATPGAPRRRTGTPPPWAWARPLYEDGLITVDFELTPRGKRRVGTLIAGEEEVARRHGVLVLDSTRARVFVLETLPGETRETVSPLVEIAAITNPERRARDREVFAESRPGVRRESPQAPQGGADDRRAASRREADRRFLETALDQALRAWGAVHVTRVVVVASPTTLGLLRPRLARRNGGRRPLEVAEYTRELTGLAPSAVHDALCAASLLPARGRRPWWRWPPPGVPLGR